MPCDTGRVLGTPAGKSHGVHGWALAGWGGTWLDPLEQGCQTHFHRGPHQRHGRLLKGRKHFINSMNRLLNNSLCIWLLFIWVEKYCTWENVSYITTQIHFIWNLQNKSMGHFSSISLRKGDHMSFRPSEATWNDEVGRIWPAGLVFDTCARETRTAFLVLRYFRALIRGYRGFNLKYTSKLFTGETY